MSKTLCPNSNCSTKHHGHPGGRTDSVVGLAECGECRERRAAEQLAAYKDALGTALYDKYKSQVQLRTLSGYNSETNTALLVLYEEMKDPDADPKRKEHVIWAIGILEKTPEAWR